MAYFYAILITLQGDTGAKAVIGNHKSDVAVLHCEKGVSDIDTPQDYKSLLGEK